MTTATRWLCAMALGASLVACGGGGDGAAPAPSADGDDVPASATASTQAYSMFVGSLPADEHSEPLGVNLAVPPTSETEEPIDVT